MGLLKNSIQAGELVRCRLIKERADATSWPTVQGLFGTATLVRKTVECLMFPPMGHGLSWKRLQRYRTNSCYCFRMTVVYAVNAL